MLPTIQLPDKIDEMMKEAINTAISHREAIIVMPHQLGIDTIHMTTGGGIGLNLYRKVYEYRNGKWIEVEKVKW